MSASPSSGSLTASFVRSREECPGKPCAEYSSVSLVESGYANFNEALDGNNSNQRNKIFSIDLADGNCSNVAAATPVAQPLVLQIDQQQQQQQQQQQDPQHPHQQQHQVGPVAAVPVHAGGTIEQPGSIAVISTQNLSYNYAPGAQNQAYPQYGGSYTSYPQYQGQPPPGYYQYQGQTPPGYPQYQGQPPPGYPQYQGYPQQGQPSAGNYGYPQGSYPMNQGNQPPPPGFGYGSQTSYVVYQKLETPEERMLFIRRVYSILAVQLLVCFGLVLLCTFNEPVRLIVSQKYVLYIAMAVYIMISFVFCCYSQQMMSTNSLSISVLIFLTVSLSLITGFIASTKSPETVLLALGITLLVTLALTVIACTCSYDFTQLMGIMCVLTVLLILFGIAAAILSNTIPILNIIYAYLGAAVFSVYIIMDTQMLMSGKKYSLTTDMAIFGAIMLFLDIVNLFLYILNITEQS